MGIFNITATAGAKGLGCSVGLIAGVSVCHNENNYSDEKIIDDFREIAAKGVDHGICAIYVWSDKEGGIRPRNDRGWEAAPANLQDRWMIVNGDSGGQRLMNILNNIPDIGEVTRSRLGHSVHGSYGIRIYSWAPSPAGRKWLQNLAVERAQKAKEEKEKKEDAAKIAAGVKTAVTPAEVFANVANKAAEVNAAHAAEAAWALHDNIVRGR